MRVGRRGGAALGMAASLTVATGALFLAPMAGSALAEDVPTDVTLTYSCPFPLVGNQSLQVRYMATAPSSVQEGEAIVVRDLKAVVTFPETTTQALTLVGAKTVEGSAAIGVALTNADPAAVAATVTVPTTNVPTSGAFDAITTSADAGSSTAAVAGTSTVSLSDLRLTLTPKTAAGAETGLGTFQSSCTLVPGQNATLTTVTVTAAPPPTTTTTTTPTTTTVPPTTTTVPPTTTTVPPTTTTVPPTTTTVPPTTTTTPPTTTTVAPAIRTVRGAGTLTAGGQRYSLAVDVRTSGAQSSGRFAISGSREFTAASRTTTAVTRNGGTSVVTGTAITAAGQIVPFRLTVVDGPGGRDQVTVVLGGRTISGTLTVGDIVGS